MIFTTLAFALAIAAALVSNWDKLIGKEKRLLGCLLVLLAISSAGTTYGKTWIEHAEAARLRRVLDEPHVGEASGGSTDDTGRAYVVDDDISRVFTFVLNPQRDRYLFQNSFPLIGADTKKPTEDDVTDLEGAAVYGSDLYLVTSHSNTRKGKESARTAKASPGLAQGGRAGQG